MNLRQRLSRIKEKMAEKGECPMLIIMPNDNAEEKIREFKEKYGEHTFNIWRIIYTKD